jgi:hypothetical protein
MLALLPHQGHRPCGWSQLVDSLLDVIFVFRLAVLSLRGTKNRDDSNFDLLNMEGASHCGKHSMQQM